MTKTWEEIRDEVAGMLADGVPLEDITGKLEQYNNEMAKAELISVFDELKKPKLMTNEEYLCTCSTEERAKFLTEVILSDRRFRMTMIGGIEETKAWLKEKHE